MPYQFDAVGWEDFNGERHPVDADSPLPDDPGGVFGILVQVDDTTTGDVDFFWAHVGNELDDWDDWNDYIESLMGMYGMELA